MLSQKNVILFIVAVELAGGVPTKVVGAAAD